MSPGWGPPDEEEFNPWDPSTARHPDEWGRDWDEWANANKPYLGSRAEHKEREREKKAKRHKRR
jgi:hypothetical protein